MKMKTLATALAVSMPLVFGTAFAQKNNATDAGNNRSSDGTSMKTDQSGSSATSSATSGNVGAGTAPGAAGAGTTGTDHTGTPGAGTNRAAGAGAAGTAGTGATGTPGEDRATPKTGGAGMAPQDSAAASTEAITGWSAKDDLMGKSVVNENDDKIGDIEDVVISSDGRTMYLLVGAGGFLGMGAKNVAVPFDRFERRDDKIVLAGYTKEQLKALPEVRTDR